MRFIAIYLHVCLKILTQQKFPYTYIIILATCIQWGCETRVPVTSVLKKILTQEKNPYVWQYVAIYAQQ